METALNQYTINIPTTDLNFFKALVKKMGWMAHKVTPSKTAAPTKTASKYKIDDIAGILEPETYQGQYRDEYLKEKYQV